jgi:hypothetical protein
MAVPSQGPVPPIVPVVDLDRADRDSDGVPVGGDDLRADIERSGGDPDAG